jgi:hypothetical protein
MTGWGSTLAAALVLAATVTAPAALADEGPVGSRVLFSFADDAIYESSGLVDTDRLVLTVNDSGDDPRVFAVDVRTGATVGVTSYGGDAVDVEALAPGRRGAVWVGDIGDNRASRPAVSVYRLPAVAPGDRRVAGERYDLTYPDGPRDAEALLVHPRTGQVLVVSKSAFGGTVYAAPRRLTAGEPNRLRPFASVAGLVTDGAFFPGGTRVLLRTYGTASVYSYPDFRLLGTVRLPRQRQGEGVSVGPGGRVLVSSEGPHAEVLQVELPAGLLRRTPADGPVRPSPGTRPPRRDARPAPPARGPGDWLAIALVAGGVAGLGWLTVRASRPRSPRRP